MMFRETAMQSVVSGSIIRATVLHATLPSSSGHGENHFIYRKTIENNSNLWHERFVMRYRWQWRKSFISAGMTCEAVIIMKRKLCKIIKNQKINCVYPI